MIPLADAQATILDAVAPLAPRPFALARRARARARARTSSRRSRCRRSRTPAWTGTRCARPTPRATTAGTLRVVGELPAGRAPTTRGRSGRGDPHHDRRADARRRRRGRDGRAHAVDGDRRRSSRPRQLGRARAPRGRRRRGRRAGVRSAARCSRPRTSVCSRASTCTRCSCHPRPRVGVISTGDELVERGPLAPGPDPRLEPSDAARGARGVGLRAGRLRHRRATTRPRSPRSIDARGRHVRRAADERRGVGRRLRLRQARARAARGRTRRSTSLWAQVAIKPAKPLAFATLGARARVRAARQPGVVTGELRAVRPARAAQARRAAPTCCPKPVVATAAVADAAPARRQAAPRPGAASGRGRPLRVRAGRRPGEQRAVGDGRAPTAWPSSTTATASTPAAEVRGPPALKRLRGPRIRRPRSVGFGRRPTAAQGSGPALVIEHPAWSLESDALVIGFPTGDRRAILSVVGANPHVWSGLGLSTLARSYAQWYKLHTTRSPGRAKRQPGGCNRVATCRWRAGLA